MEEVKIEEKVVSGEPPPAYCTLFRNESRLDPSRTPEVVASEVDEEPLVGATFLNKTARIGFIQKVLAIRFLQVFASFVFIIVAAGIWKEYYEVFDTRSNLMLASSLLYFITIIPLFCYYNVVSNPPFNCIFLAAYPLTSAFAMVVITTGYLSIRVEFCLAWLCYTLMMLAQLTYSVFCLHTKMEYRMRSATLVAAIPGIVTFGVFVLLFPFTNDSYGNMNLSILWVFFLTLLVFGECAHAVYQLCVMTGGENNHPLTPQDYVAGAIHTHMIFGYNYSKYAKILKSKVCSFF